MAIAKSTATVEDRVRMDEIGPRLMKIGGAVGLLGLGATVALGATFSDGGKRFFFTYLVSLMFVLSLALGGLFFVTLQHLTRAGWSVTVRRIAELMAATLPLLALLTLPIIVPMVLGDGSLYEWVSPDPADHLLHKKAAYLNVPFFVARVVGYFVIWSLLARFFLRRSTEQDQSGDPLHTVAMERVSAPGMILFALTLTFAAFDLLMSLEPHWFSTIFGVYYFGGSCMAFFAMVILLAKWLQRGGIARQAITVEHYHDLGKLLFAFVFFWGYIAFSQFMLIWYANIPEETEWFQHRLHGSWAVVSWTLVIGHFAVPFLGLISRHIKRNGKVLAFWAMYLLVMHWVDMYWLAMPAYDGHGAPFHLIDATAAVGMLGMFLGAVGFVARDKLAVAIKDPRIGEAIAFENV